MFHDSHIFTIFMILIVFLLFPRILQVCASFYLCNPFYPMS